MKWSILIPTVPARRSLLPRVLEILEPQVELYPDVELLILEDNRKREYGLKLQAMVDIAQGEYVNFVDDDDLVSYKYVDTIYPLLDGVDAVGFTGQVSVNDGPYMPVYYSKENRQWLNTPDGYYRSPQHLTPIRRDIVKQVPWTGHYGADKAWADELMRRDLIKTENITDATLYYYLCKTMENKEGVWI